MQYKISRRRAGVPAWWISSVAPQVSATTLPVTGVVGLIYSKASRHLWSEMLAGNSEQLTTKSSANANCNVTLSETWGKALLWGWQLVVSYFISLLSW